MHVLAVRPAPLLSRFDPPFAMSHTWCSRRKASTARLRLVALIFASQSLLMCRTSANILLDVPETNSCADPATYSWMYNSEGQSPCEVTTALVGQCNITTSWSVCGEVYCCTVTYSLYSACLICNGLTSEPWLTYFDNAGCTSDCGGLSSSIIPLWASLPLLNDQFNIKGAQQEAESTQTATHTSSASPTQTTTASTETTSHPVSTQSPAPLDENTSSNRVHLPTTTDLTTTIEQSMRTQSTAAHVSGQSVGSTPSSANLSSSGVVTSQPPRSFSKRSRLRSNPGTATSVTRSNTVYARHCLDSQCHRILTSTSLEIPKGQLVGSPELSYHGISAWGAASHLNRRRASPSVRVLGLLAVSPNPQRPSLLMI
ncbi:hypothetical protein GY45DRAFT_1060988 [Cubamyces sp. BRFM 1775]|nr:hypothetical protein GY45DRAFT_1060988 [Cubamyces sp. BRFM 1775]